MDQLPSQRLQQGRSMSPTDRLSVRFPKEMLIGTRIETTAHCIKMSSRIDTACFDGGEAGTNFGGKAKEEKERKKS